MQQSAAKNKSQTVKEGRTAGATRLKILSSARTLFAERGFEGTSTRDIAERAGVNKRLIFYYFESKEDLYLRTLEDFFRGVESLLQNFCVTPQDLADPWLSLLNFSDNFVDFIAKNQEPTRILIREILNEGRFLDVLVERFIGPIFEAGEEYLGQVLQSGFGDKKAVQHLLLSFGGANIFYFILGPLLARTWDVEVTSPKRLEERKLEMRRFILRTL